MAAEVNLYKDKKMWTYSDTCDLINLYEAQPCLWDATSAEYRNKGLKAEAVRSISQIFGTNPAEIHRKLHNLRTQFCGELKKMRSKQEGEGDFESRWPYFNMMRFIQRGAAAHYSSTALPVKSPTAGIAHAEDTLELGSLSSEDSQPISEADVTQPSSSSSLPAVNKPLYTVRARSEPVIKKPKVDEEYLLQKASDLMSKFDEQSVFGDFVAQELREVRSEQLRRRLKLNIQKAILDIAELDQRQLYGDLKN